MPQNIEPLASDLKNNLLLKEHLPVFSLLLTEVREIGGKFPLENFYLSLYTHMIWELEFIPIWIPPNLKINVKFKMLLS